jgi:eukaryotic-like serine/threonine-protein kinase
MTDRTGQQLGHYRLVRLLGRGGFAEVYLGEHDRLKTQAAIKVLHSAMEEDYIEGFLREAQTVARLKHSHIVRVFDFDVQDYIPYLVMDYLPNGNIRRSRPKGSRLPLETIVSYVNQVSSALQYAHDQRLIHRDVKPENMLLDQDNSIVLSDFGIALMAQTSSYQSTQEVAGTAAYMAPEQFQGHPHRASDQYSLGVVTYEWLCGDLPFHGMFSEIASQHMFVPPPSLHAKVHSISPDVEQVVLTALAKNSQGRFPSVQAFATALELACETVKTRPVTLKSEKSPPKQPSLSPNTDTNIPPNQTSQPTILATPTRTPLNSNTSRANNTDKTTYKASSDKGGQNIFQAKSPSQTTIPASRRSNRRIGIIALIGLLVLLFISGSIIILPNILRNPHINSTSIVHVGSINSVTSQANATSTADEAFFATVYSHLTATANAKDKVIFSLPNGLRLVLDDPLYDNSKGYQWDNNGSYCQFVGGSYQVASSSGYNFCIANATNFGNLVYQVQMRITSGDCGGILFDSASHGQDFADGLTLEICQTGSYSLRDSSVVGTISQGVDPAIKTGLNQTNILSVILSSGAIQLYINQKLVDSVHNSTYTGQIGVFSSWYSTAVFSDARVWVP